MRTRAALALHSPSPMAVYSPKPASRAAHGSGGRSTPAPATHHGHELFEIDGAVAILIDILQQLQSIFATQGLLDIVVLQYLPQLLQGDASVAVKVEDLELYPACLLRQVLLPVQ